MRNFNGEIESVFYTGKKEKRKHFVLREKLHSHLTWRSLFLTPIIIWLVLAGLFDFSFGGYAFGVNDGVDFILETLATHFFAGDFLLFMLIVAIAIFIFRLNHGFLLRNTHQETKSKALFYIPATFLVTVFYGIMFIKPVIIPVWSNDYTKVMSKAEAVEYIHNKASTELDELIAKSEWKEASELADKMFFFSGKGMLPDVFWQKRKRDLVRKAVLEDFANTELFPNYVASVFSEEEFVGMLAEYLLNIASDTQVRTYCTSNISGITTPFVLAQDYSKPLLEICKLGYKPVQTGF